MNNSINIKNKHLLNLSNEERDMALDGLKSVLGYNMTTSIPTIDEFIENDDYLGLMTGNGKNIYDFWKDILRELFPSNLGSKYHTLFLNNAIGSGKSVVSDIICAYLLCKMILMENPHKFFNLLPTKYIEIYFYGASQRIITATKSPFLELLSGSPFFRRNLVNMTKSSMEFKNRIKISSGSSVLSNVSRDIFLVRMECRS